LPRPSEIDSKEFYDRNLQDKGRGKKIDLEKLRINSRYDTERHVRLVEELCPGKECRLLDIGAGYGFFLEGLSRRGFSEVMGVEISEERRALALEHCSAPIIDYDVDDPKADIGRFEIITLFHVLEHVADPIDFLRQTGKLLAPGGVLVVEVPNVDEMLLDTCQAYNDFYWIRAHLHYFSQETLRECFRRAGFDKVDVRFEQRYGLINLCNWLLTGEPQIEQPVFTIDEAYDEVESYYRQFIERQGKSDTLVAMARKTK
jgi:2-polyprenyl-3-methyl-5-hydroxy-6-metoxy-1,4-benzoquinol methylase